jgi:hypothetical protein
MGTKAVWAGSFLLTIGLVTSCGGPESGPSDTIVVGADDGSAILTIPSDSLPAGLDPAELSVRRVPDDELGEDADTGRAYLLEPPGTILGPGAYLATTVAAPDGSIPWVGSITSGDLAVAGSDEPFPLSFDTADGVQVLVDLATETATVWVPVPHFSTYFFSEGQGKYAFFQVKGTSGRAVVGDLPDASAEVARVSTDLTSGDYPGQSSFEVHISDLTGYPSWFYLPVETHTHYRENEGKKGTISLRFHMIEGSARLQGAMWHGTDSRDFERNARSNYWLKLEGEDAYPTQLPENTLLTPAGTIENRPPSTPFTDRFTVENRDFRCARAGTGKLAFDFTITWKEEVELQRAWDPTWRVIREAVQKNWDVAGLVPVTCDAAAGSSTTTSSTTTTAPGSTGTGDDDLGGLLDRIGLPVHGFRATGDVVDVDRDARYAYAVPDPRHDHIDSISTQPSAYTGPEVDIIQMITATAIVDQNWVDSVFNHSLLPCFARSPVVVCAPDSQPMGAGGMLVVMVQHDDLVPTSPAGTSYIYSLVFDSNGLADDNWHANPPFDWDYFAGTDRWYQATYDHVSKTWVLFVTQVSADGTTQQVLPSAVRAVIIDDWFVWFVPESELPSYPSPLRATAFAHDGAFTPETRGGDVTGADPTEDLFSPPPLP